MPAPPQNAFPDKAKAPSEKELTSALGPSATSWNGLIQFLDEFHSPITQEWKKGKTGWMLVPKRKTRTVCYLFPAENYFTVAFVLGNKAVEAARQSKLPKTILNSIEEARPYTEGRGFYVECRKPTDLKHLLTLVALKMES